MAPRKTKRRNNTRRRHHRGGSGMANPSSFSDAASYELATAGDMNSQIDRVNNAPGPANNAIISIQGQRAGSRTRRHKKRKALRGGFWGVINEAAVPLALLGMQQSYRRGKKSKRRSHRRR